MDKKQTSGHCRSTAFFLFIFLALCVTVASAATLNSNLVVSRATLQIATTTAPVYATCPAGYDCMTDADATARLGTYAKYSDAVCGYMQSTTAMALIKAPQYCVKKTETQYPAICPAGCSCMMESAAKEKFGTYSRCSESPCYTVVTGSAQVNAYCFRQSVTTTTTRPTVSTCPMGCVCLSDVTAKAQYGDYTRCTADVCGYEQGSLTNALASNQVAKYCVKQVSTTPTCPEGCSCISEATAKVKGGTWSRCSADICGYDQSTTTPAAVVPVPKYCMKQQETTPACPDDCACISDEDAKLKGLTQRCDTSRTPCGYRSVDATANTAAQRIPLYCYKVTITATTSQTPSLNCSYDPQKNECTGICTNGKFCVITGKEADKKTGNKTPVCGCPWNSCTFDYGNNTCTGSCPVTGETCQLNTMNTDPTTGKVIYADCHCKSGGDTSQTCACDVASGSCTGTCAEGKACSMTGRTTDNAGKVVCKSCGCVDTCVLNANNECSGTCANQQSCTRIVTKDASGQDKVSCGCGGTLSQVAARQPGILESIGSFFNRLLGGK